MAKFREYTKEIALHLDEKYNDLVENIFANDVAWDLSAGEKPDSVYLNRSGGINRYYSQMTMDKRYSSMCLT